VRKLFRSCSNTAFMSYHTSPKRASHTGVPFLGALLFALHFSYDESGTIDSRKGDHHGDF
jgi:hypothetical protein